MRTSSLLRSCPADTPPPSGGGQAVPWEANDLRQMCACLAEKIYPIMGLLVLSGI